MLACGNGSHDDVIACSGGTTGKFHRLAREQFVGAVVHRDRRQTGEVGFQKVHPRVTPFHARAVQPARPEEFEQGRDRSLSSSALPSMVSLVSVASNRAEMARIAPGSGAP